MYSSNSLKAFVILSVLVFASCEKTLESVPGDQSVVVEEFETPRLGFANVSTEVDNEYFTAFGFIELENTSIPFENGGGTVIGYTVDRFGFDLLLGDDFGMDAGEIYFNPDGKISYYISMIDPSDPIDSTAVLEIGKEYPADFYYFEASSLEEYDTIEANNLYFGVGEQTISVMITKVTSIAIEGEYEGYYIDSNSNESIPVSGKFNANRTI